MGITIVVILLVPLMFQVFMGRQEQKKRNEEFLGILTRIEEKLGP